MSKDADLSDLLARLNALKGSSNPATHSDSKFISKGALHPSITPRSGEVDIEARFRRLASGGGVSPQPGTGGKSGSGSGIGSGKFGRGDVEIEVSGLKGETVRNEEDDIDLDELLAELELKEGEGWEDGKEGGDGEQLEIRKLLAEARDALEEGRTRDEGVEKDGREEDTGGGDHKDEEAADEYIQQVMADIEIRRQQGIPDSEDEQEAQSKPTHGKEDDDDEEMIPLAGKSPDHKDDADTLEHSETPANPRAERESTPFDLIPSPPSTAPTTLPSTTTTNEQQQDQDQEQTDPLTARLQALKTPSALSLPKPPTTKPCLKPKPTKPKETTPKYTDEDIDACCSICTEDAVVLCLGCEGDLYCQECWDEGHRAKGAGMDERSHRAVVFSRDKRKPAQRVKKGLVGAT